MLIKEVTSLQEKGKQWKAKSKKPKLVKPTIGHESPHPGRGLLVGEAPEDNVIQGKFPNHRVPQQQEFDFGPEFAKENDVRFEIWGKIKLPAERFEAWTLFGSFKTEAKAFDKLRRVIKPVQQGVNPFAPEKMKMVKININEPRTMDFNAIKQAIAKNKAVLLPVPQLGVTDKLEENKIPFTKCPKCGGKIFHESEGKKDACYHKVKSRYKVWPSAYASGALVKCRKVGADNWGNSKSK